MEYYTVSEVAELLRVSEMTVRRWIWSGKLPAVRTGRLVRIRQIDVRGLPVYRPRAHSGSPAGPRAGSAPALLEAVLTHTRSVDPADVLSVEAFIAEGCERVDREEPPLD